jgi:hypothetical protein
MNWADPAPFRSFKRCLAWGEMRIPRNRILGAIAALLGAAVLGSRIAAGGVRVGSGAYMKGQFLVLGFAVLLLAVGLYYLITGGPSHKPRRR